MSSSPRTIEAAETLAAFADQIAVPTEEPAVRPYVVYKNSAIALPLHSLLKTHTRILSDDSTPICPRRLRLCLADASPTPIPHQSRHPTGYAHPTYARRPQCSRQKRLGGRHERQSVLLGGPRPVCATRAYQYSRIFGVSVGIGVAGSGYGVEPIRH